MKICNEDFVESYNRPCLAVCKKYKNHGVFIFKDGSYSDGIHSLTVGKELLKKLVLQGVVDSENAERILDQLACSELPLYEDDIDMEAVLTAGLVATVLVATLCPKIEIGKPKSSGSSDDTQSFSC